MNSFCLEGCQDHTIRIKIVFSPSVNIVIYLIIHLQLGPKAEDVSKPVNPVVFLLRFMLGAMAGAYYVLVPIYMWLKDQIVPKDQPI